MFRIGADALGLPRAELPFPQRLSAAATRHRADDQPRKGIIDKSLGAGIDVFPIAILFVDIRAGFLARGAFRALRVRRLTQTMGLCIDFFNEGNRTEIVAPSLAGV